MNRRWHYRIADWGESNSTIVKQAFRSSDILSTPLSGLLYDFQQFLVRTFPEVVAPVANVVSSERLQSGRFPSIVQQGMPCPLLISIRDHKKCARIRAAAYGHNVKYRGVMRHTIGDTRLIQHLLTMLQGAAAAKPRDLNEPLLHTIS